MQGRGGHIPTLRLMGPCLVSLEALFQFPICHMRPFRFSMGFKLQEKQQCESSLPAGAEPDPAWGFNTGTSLGVEKTPAPEDRAVGQACCDAHTLSSPQHVHTRPLPCLQLCCLVWKLPQWCVRDRVVGRASPVT